MYNQKLLQAAREGNIDEVRELLNLGAEVNAKDDEGGIALHYAAAWGHNEVVKLLLDQQDIDVNAKDNEGSIALHGAAAGGHDKVVKLLIEQIDVDVHAKGDQGRTALHYAAEDGHSEVVKLLIEEAGADVNAKDDVGRTVLHCAASIGHDEVVIKLLIEKIGVDTLIKDQFDKTPFQLFLQSFYCFYFEIEKASTLLHYFFSTEAIWRIKGDPTMEESIIDYNKTVEAAKKINIEALKQARDEEYTGIKKQYKIHEDLPLSHEAFAWFIVNHCKLVDEMERLSRLVIRPMFSSSLLSQVSQEIWDIIILKSLQSINDTRLSNLLTQPQHADYTQST